MRKGDGIRGPLTPHEIKQLTVQQLRKVATFSDLHLYGLAVSSKGLGIYSGKPW